MVDWEIISYIIASKARLGILKYLDKNVGSPTQLAKELSISMPSISKALGELMEKKLVTCLTPNRRKSKIYKITELGKEVIDKIQEIGG